MELNPDEAYYWVYSQFLDWGYFDHPPMVALHIWLGDQLFSNTLDLRLITVITNTVSIYILWLIVKEYVRNIKLFILLFSCFLLFHVYGFITTPDSPLLFYSTLFFYLYGRYSKRDSWILAFFLSIVVTLLLYSKYHAVLLLLFTVLSNFKLLKRPSFWGIVILSILLYTPHILWQISHDYPSVQYHLFDRSATPYKINFTLDYILGQILIAGPLVGWFLYWSAAKAKARDPLLKALKFNFYGIFVFFLISTLKGSIEAHWTLIAFPPVFILAYVHLARKQLVPRWFIKLALANILLILLARLILIIPIPYLKDFKPVQVYYDSEEWAHKIQEKAGENYVIFNQGFQQPSKYNFYTQQVKALGYTSRYYRRNQYDYWPIEDSLRYKDVYFVTPRPHEPQVPQDSIHTSRGTYYGRWIEDVRIYQKVTIDPVLLNTSWQPDEVKNIELIINNPYQEEINLKNVNANWKVYLEYGYMQKGKILEIFTIDNAFEGLVIEPLEQEKISVQVKAPPTAGEYKLFFSIRTEPFPGNRNSGMIKMKVE